MYAGQLFNQQQGKPQTNVFGCVTKAFSWCFLKLEGQNLYIDPNYLPLTFTQPHQVLGALQTILHDAIRQAAA
jgi:hypothetical protein